MKHKKYNIPSMQMDAETLKAIDLLKNTIKDSKQKEEQILNSLEFASKHLGATFILCGLKSHMNATIIIGDETFKLSFTKQG